MAEEEIPLLHVYGQSEPHDEVWIVGNPRGLSLFLRALQEAISRDFGEENVFVSGPEGGFSLRILCFEEPPEAEFWKDLAVPYRGQDWAEEKRPHALWPIQLAPTQRLPVPSLRETE